MSVHTVTIDSTCPSCGQVATLTVTARTRDSGLRVSSSLSCRRCGFAEESDADELTEAARAAFYASQGRWSVVIEDLGPAASEALGRLRAMLGMDARVVLEAIRHGRALATGTLVEAEQLGLVAHQLGVTYSVVAAV